MNEIEALDLAIKLASQYHYGSVDKSGQPYILHPLAVMNKMNSYVEKIVAVLHDVVEDTQFTLLELKYEGFSDEIIEAVDAISRREGESAKKYYERIMNNTIAIKVKISDLEHNMSMSRLLVVTEKDLNRVRYYHSRWKMLNEKINRSLL